MKKARAASSILATALGLGLCLSMVGCSDTGTAEVALVPSVSGDALVEAGTLTVGVDTSQPPFAYVATGDVDEDGEISANEIVGLDIDVAAALADELGLELSVVDISDTSTNTALTEGEVDIVMSASTESSSVGSRTYVGPYVDNGQVLFGIDDGSEEEIDTSALSEYTVGAYTGSIASTLVVQYAGTDNLVLYTSMSEMFDALVNGEIDLVAADAVSGGYVSTLYSNVTCKGSLDSSSGCYIALQQSNTELSEALVSALETIDGNGVLDTVISKWCGTYTVSFASPAISDSTSSEDSE